MKEQWNQLAAKIDVLSQRERIILFVVALLVAFMAIYLPLLSPLLTKRERLQNQISSQGRQLTQIEAQIAAQENPAANDPNQSKRQRLAELRDEASRIEQDLQALQKTLVPPDQMSAVLEDLLKRDASLKLVALTTLPVTSLITSANAAKPVMPASAPDAIPQARPTEPTPAPPAEPSVQIFKHGVQITVEGNYRDLLRYLSELEKLPWRMYWFNVQLQTDENAPHPRMTFTVFTLSLEKTWLSL